MDLITRFASRTATEAILWSVGYLINGSNDFPDFQATFLDLKKGLFRHFLNNLTKIETRHGLSGDIESKSLLEFAEFA